MRDIKPVLLLLLSIGLVGTWAYHLYDKAHYSRQAVLSSRDSLTIAQAVRDSLTRHYNGTISDLDMRLNNATVNVDTLQSRLAMKLQEIARLRAEIVSILGRKDLSKSELGEANEKMAVLQEKLSELHAEKLILEEQKEEFSLAVQNLTKNTDSLQQKLKVLSVENEHLVRKVNSGGIFVASDLKIAAMNSKGTREQETNQAKKADKFVISFNIQNHSADYSNAEIAIVIIQPNHQVLQNTNWESGSFISATEGSKSYTRLVRFDYLKGEKRAMNFSLDTEDPEKGNYLLQIWHKGILIGQASLLLS